MGAAFLIARKDLSQRLRDKSAFIYGIIAPLGLAFLFSAILNPVQDAKFSANYVVVDHDKGAISQAFKQVLTGLEDEKIATVRFEESLAEAKAQVARGSSQIGSTKGKEVADAAFMLPAGLSAGVTSGQGGSITVVGATGSGLAAQVAYSVAQGFGAELGAVEVAVRTALASNPATDPAKAAALMAAAAHTASPVELSDASAKTRQLSQITYMAAGMAIFFLFFTVSFGVSGILEERRLGTMTRLLAAPVNPTSIVLGKALTSFVLGILSMSILVVASTLLFGAEWGNPLGVAMLVVSAVIAAMGILFVVAATAKTQDQAGSFQAIISLVLAFLGGTFFSISQVGGLMERLSLLTPHAWFLRGLGDLQGGEIASVLPAVGALLAFGVVTGGIAWPFARKAVQR